jgi:hypothetical protein
MSNIENDTILQELNFNDAHLNSPVTRAHTKSINFKNAVQLTFSILKNEKERKKDASENIIFQCVTFHLTIAPFVMLEKNLILQKNYLTNAAIVTSLQNSGFN